MSDIVDKYNELKSENEHLRNLIESKHNKFEALESEAACAEMQSALNAVLAEYHEGYGLNCIETVRRAVANRIGQGWHSPKRGRTRRG